LNPESNGPPETSGSLKKSLKDKVSVVHRGSCGTDCRTEH